MKEKAMRKRVSLLKSYREFPENCKRQVRAVSCSLELWSKSDIGRSMGMLRGMEGEWLKMASEQRTDYGMSGMSKRRPI